jgi:Domain of unknown function (DUF4386)
VYLLFFVTVILGAVLSPATSGLTGGLADAAATAKSILAHEGAYRLAWALTLISTAFYVALMALFYQLFRPVSRTFALLVVFFGLVGCAVTALQSLFQIAPLVVLSGNGYLSAFDATQLQALALVFLNLKVQVGYIALVFFGGFQLALGYLIFRSTFLPRILGALIAFAGVGWLIFLSPPIAHSLLIYLEVLGFFAEAALMLWLLVRGVNVQRWQQVASGSSQDA